MKTRYIHYGHKHFKPNLFVRIYNVYYAKPLGGLWGSPIDTKNSWKDFCERENFAEYDKENSLEFVLKDDRTSSFRRFKIVFRTLRLGLRQHFDSEQGCCGGNQTRRMRYDYLSYAQELLARSHERSKNVRLKGGNV